MLDLSGPRFKFQLVEFDTIQSFSKTSNLNTQPSRLLAVAFFGLVNFVTSTNFDIFRTLILDDFPAQNLK